MATTFFLIGGGLIVVLLIVGVFISATSERALLEERLGKYLEDDIPVKKGRDSGPTALTE